MGPAEVQRVMITINERPCGAADGVTVAELAAVHKPDADIFIVNGYPVEPATVVHDGDSCWLIRRGEAVSAAEMDRLLYARHTPGVHDRIKHATVGIMGLGGLGSPLALALARIGVGCLLLADFDVVEPSNLNRQQYTIDQVGMAKTEAMAQNLARVNPYITVHTENVRLSAANIPEIFGAVDVLAECFDNAAMKAVALRTVMNCMPAVSYVGASGLAGYGPNNAIQTTCLRPGIYLVGDGESAAAPGQGLMAPRVGIAAHHQANQVLRLLLGEDNGRPRPDQPSLIPGASG